MLIVKLDIWPDVGLRRISAQLANRDDDGGDLAFAKQLQRIHGILQTGPV